MIRGKKILAVIPARGGSKGVPRKNIRIVAGKPLIAYTIFAAQQSQYLDRLVISSEDSEILAVAENFGVETLVRPSDLSLDETPGIQPVLHAIEENPGYYYVVLLQPTSPLRTARDIDSAIELCISANARACVSVCQTSQSPYWMFTISSKIRLQPFTKGQRPTRRQDLPPTYVLNGAIYLAEIDWLKRIKDFVADDTVAYVMPEDRSLDIDTENDLVMLEKILRNSVVQQTN